HRVAGQGRQDRATQREVEPGRHHAPGRATRRGEEGHARAQDLRQGHRRGASSPPLRGEQPLRVAPGGRGAVHQRQDQGRGPHGDLGAAGPSVVRGRAVPPGVHLDAARRTSALYLVHQGGAGAAQAARAGARAEGHRRQRSMKRLLAAIAALACGVALAPHYRAPKEVAWTVSDFRFHPGETLPQLRLAYTTVGDPKGEPVVVLHGTGGSARSMLTPAFAGELFGPGQPLDATKYFIVIP